MRYLVADWALNTNHLSGARDVSSPGVPFKCLVGFTSISVFFLFNCFSWKCSLQ